MVRTDVGEEADTGIDGTNISAESVTARVCVSADGNSRREPSTAADEEEEKIGAREKRGSEREK